MVHVTKSTKPISATNIARSWYLIDVNGKVLGRVAQEIATILQGKSKVTYAPYLDAGDNVVVINAKQVTVTGKKADAKLYTRYSGYPGGLTTETFAELIVRRPDEVIRRAVSGMLPKNKLRDRRLARLHIFADARHTFTNELKDTKSEMSPNK